MHSRGVRWIGVVLNAEQKIGRDQDCSKSRSDAFFRAQVFGVRQSNQLHQGCDFGGFNRAAGCTRRKSRKDSLDACVTRCGIAGEDSLSARRFLRSRLRSEELKVLRKLVRIGVERLSSWKACAELIINESKAKR